MQKIIDRIKNKIIVSCQAASSEPLYKEECMIAMMESTINGGAEALRLAGKRDIKNARKLFGKEFPIIGITKPDPIPENFEEIAYITPSIKDVKEIINVGADIIAFDGTSRPRGKENLAQIIHEIKKHNKIAMADISTLEEGLMCRLLGADVISTTLSGYTSYTKTKNDEPDFELLQKLVKILTCPIILEGKVWTPNQAKKAFKLGAHSVVIGSAITRPQLITNRFIKSI